MAATGAETLVAAHRLTAQTYSSRSSTPPPASKSRSHSSEDNRGRTSSTGTVDGHQSGRSRRIGGGPPAAAASQRTLPPSPHSKRVREGADTPFKGELADRNEEVGHPRSENGTQRHRVEGSTTVAAETASTAATTHKTVPTPSAVPPNDQEEDRPLLVYLNDLPTKIDPQDSSIVPAACFAPRVLLLDVTAAHIAEAQQEPFRQELLVSLQSLEQQEGAARRSLKTLRERRRRRAASALTRNAPADDAAAGREGPRHRRRHGEQQAACSASAEATCEPDRLPQLQAELADIMAQRQAVQRMLKAGPPPPPPPVLLLPSARDGSVQLADGHRYRTVKFTGEHLCLTGQLQSWVPPQPPNRSVCADEEGDEQPDGREAPQTTAPISRSNTPWASRELEGMRAFLLQHPDKCAADYYRLSTEEMAYYQTQRG